MLSNVAQPFVLENYLEPTNRFSIRSILLASLVSTALIFIGTLFAGWFQLQQMRDAHLWVSHSYRVVHAIERLICLVKDEETDQIVLSLSGDQTLAKADRTLIKRQFENVKTLTDLGAKQSDKIDHLESKIKNQILTFHENLKPADSKSQSGGGMTLLSKSKKDMDEINQELIHLQDDEVRLLDSRLDASRQSAERLEGTLISISAVALLLFFTLIFAISRYLTEKEKAAITDELTGLHNSRGFNLLISQILKTSKRNGLECGLCFIDMDGLKTINDRYGHDEGSNALKALAQAIKSAFRDEDIVARWGGDEFVVAGAFRTAPSEIELRSRLDLELAKKQKEENFPFTLKASLGVKTLKSDQLNLTAVTKAITEADENMYVAKKSTKELQIPLLKEE
jgi:diguanylate cyclase (GGDEF)-like protein